MHRTPTAESRLSLVNVNYINKYADLNSDGRMINRTNRGDKNRRDKVERTEENLIDPEKSIIS